MALLDEVKGALRIRSSTIYDDEITTLIESCLYDLDRLGICYDVINMESEVKQCVFAYVKANLGTADVDRKQAFYDAYKRTRKALMMDKSKHRVGD